MISKKIKAISIGSVTTAMVAGTIGAIGVLGNPNIGNSNIRLTSANVSTAYKTGSKKKTPYSYSSPTVSSTQAITDGLGVLHITNPSNLSLRLTGNKQHVPIYHIFVKPPTPGAAHIAVVNGLTGAAKAVIPHHKIKNTYTSPKITAMQAITDAEGTLHVSNPTDLRLRLVGTKKHVPIYKVFIKASKTTKAQIVSVNGLTGVSKIVPMHFKKGHKKG